MEEQAWYYEEDYDYFKKLLKQLKNMSDQTVYMILSEDCDLKTITQVADLNKIKTTEVFKKIVGGEKNYIFELKKN